MVDDTTKATINRLDFLAHMHFSALQNMQLWNYESYNDIHTSKLCQTSELGYTLSEICSLFLINICFGIGMTKYMFQKF